VACPPQPWSLQQNSPPCAPAPPRGRPTFTRSPNGGLAAARRAANLAMPDASTAYTRAAPACAANSDRMPDPAPTSITVFPSKSGRLPRMAAWYVPVRVTSCGGRGACMGGGERR
jgi:hypothetical protein